VADKKSKSQPVDLGDAAESQPSLGHVISEARERKGLTRDQVANETHVPMYYIKMIETDSYDQIADRLYLVPFIRRYASFLGLDAEEIASRFVSDVQHAEANVVRISQEITMVTKRSGGGSRIAFAVLIAAVAVMLADLAWRHFVEHEAIIPTAANAPAVMAPASVPAPVSNENLPPATIVSNPDAASAAGAKNSQPAGAASAATQDAPSQNMPPERDDN
jgi:cytoskeleton protein RodZ